MANDLMTWKIECHNRSLKERLSDRMNSPVHLKRRTLIVTLEARLGLMLLKITCRRALGCSTDIGTISIWKRLVHNDKFDIKISPIKLSWPNNVLFVQTRGPALWNLLKKPIVKIHLVLRPVQILGCDARNLNSGRWLKWKCSQNHSC